MTETDMSKRPPQERSGALRAAIYNPETRGIFYQTLTIVVLLGLTWWIVDNTITNLARAGTKSGFDFLSGRAGFDIGQSMISYSSDSTYLRALVVGFLNTLLVAITGIITATIIGLIIGLGRLSQNWLIAKLATVYIEVFRNIPPLLIIFFWYSGVLTVLPQANDAFELPLSIFVSNRGVTLPMPIFENGFSAMLIAFAVAVIAVVAVLVWANRRQTATGKQFPKLWISIALLIGLPALAFFAVGQPLSFEYPSVGRFSMTGGLKIGPEFLSLYLALSFYTAAFIAETIRAGIRGVNKGQTEAASALGLQSSHVMRLVVLPQALRIIIPPLTNQYLNLTKNSSLAIAVGFSDLVAVGGTILNQSSRSIEVVVIWMVVYLSLSIITAAIMNWVNNRMALVER